MAVPVPFREDCSDLQRIELADARQSSLAEVLLIAAANADKLKAAESEKSRSLTKEYWQLPLSRLLFDCVASSFRAMLSSL